jgi:putative hemolysin
MSRPKPHGGHEPVKRPFDATEILRKFLPPQGPVNRGAPPAPLAWLPAYVPELALNRRLDAPLPHSLGRLGDLEVRLARDANEIRKAQALRYRVFYEEMSAVPNPAAALTRLDADFHDAICDHMLVIDHARFDHKPFRKREPRVVGTYRLLRGEVAELNGGFYTASEFEIDPLLARHPSLRVLELGRSCVLAPYRDKRTVELLWHGVWSYVLAHRVDLMFGCASLEGTNPDRLAVPLSFLHHHARAAGEWLVEARPSRRVDMNRVAKEALDTRAALSALPPLIKGYLRLGAMIGDGAVVDRQFGTTDVCIVLPTSKISQRYIGYFGADAQRHRPEPVAA